MAALWAEAMMSEEVGVLRSILAGYQPAWMADALCREYPEVNFFGAGRKSVQRAKAVCSSCLVREACLSFAEALPTAPEGVWGGTSERERRHRPIAA